VEKAENRLVARHLAGSTDPEQLDDKVAKAWSSALNDPQDGAKVAAILGLNQQDLQDVPPPFKTEVRKAGLTGAEIVVVFAGAFAVAYAKKLGTAAGNAAAEFTLEQARRLWPILKRWMFRSETEVLGDELDASGI
jgi:hypothetical protein